MTLFCGERGVTMRRKKISFQQLENDVVSELWAGVSMSLSNTGRVIRRVAGNGVYPPAVTHSTSSV